MPQPQQQPRAPSYSADDYVLATIGWLLFPALMGAVFTRHRFGIRAIANPRRYVLGTLAFVASHELGIIAGHWRNPTFFQSAAWDYVLVMYTLSLVHLAEAWRAFRRRDRRHGYFFGEPYLMLLGIPYQLACCIDGALIFAFGAWVRRFDVALGVFLMFGGFGLLLLLLGGIRQAFRDTSDLMDAGYYASNIQDSVERAPPVFHPSQHATPADEEELSTSAQGSRE